MNGKESLARRVRGIADGTVLVVSAGLVACGGESNNLSPYTPDTTPVPVTRTLVPSSEPQRIIVETPHFKLKSNNLPPPIREAGEDTLRERRDMGHRWSERGTDGKNYYPAAVELPEELQKRLFEAIEPLNSRLPQVEGPLAGVLQKVSKIEIYPEYPKLAELGIRGVPDPLSQRIQIFMAPDIKIPVTEIEIVAFHEMAHIFLPTEVIFRQGILSSEFEFLEKQAKEAWEQRELPSLNKYKSEGWQEKVSSLFNLVDESSYIGGITGHPYSFPSELFASTVTVFRFFPESFISLANNLTPEDRRFMKSLGKHVIELIKAQSEDPNADQIFDPQLLEFLYSE